jgi:hypothetical protein
MHTHWSQWRDGRCQINQWDEYPIENLKTIEIFAHFFIDVAILELGVAFSP